MGKNRSNVSRRAWNVLRMALLRARKGGALRRSLMLELRLLPNYIKSLGHVNARESICYTREKEFSFDETPLFNIKMHRPASFRFHLPCIKPQVDFEYEFDGEDQDSVYRQEDEKYYLREESYGCVSVSAEVEDEKINDEIISVEDEAIDVKAEEFIQNFYKQMKMQRQISYLEYSEKLNRKTC